MTIATLLVSCPDRTGLVAAMSDFVFRQGGNIVDLDQHSDPDSGTFFMRLVFDTAGFRLDHDGIAAAIAVMGRSYDMTWQLTYSDQRPRVAVFCTKVPHCLYDLLLAQRLGDLAGDVVVVASNHRELEPVAAHFQVPFLHIPVGEDKAAAEAAQSELLARERIDLTVLARYMQVLSPEFVRARPGRIINIHHSFLPAFVGAKPYHQAKERGVKLIGATAHYVTEDLDEGPIIEQDVIRVSHRHTVADLKRLGSDIERQVLARAVRWHLEDRVLVDGNKTIVFD